MAFNMNLIQFYRINFADCDHVRFMDPNELSLGNLSVRMFSVK